MPELLEEELDAAPLLELVAVLRGSIEMVAVALEVDAAGLAVVTEAVDAEA